MTSKKLQKKQARDKAVQEKLHRQRLARMEDRKKATYERRLTELVRQRPRPIARRTEEEEEAEVLARDLEIRNQLERNMEILKALEEEHDREVEARRLINDKLEGEGLLTLKEKMDALTAQIADAQKAEHLKTGLILDQLDSDASVGVPECSGQSLGN